MDEREDLIQHITELSNEIGEKPSAADIQRADDRPPISRYYAVFESWEEALQTAGYKPHKHSNTHSQTERQLLRYIHELSEEIGNYPPSKGDMDRADKYPTSTVFQEKFGSWNSAVEEAGFEPNTTAEKYTEEELLKHIQGLYDELGCVPRMKDMRNAESRPSEAPFRRVFGSWSMAVEQAGFTSRGNQGGGGGNLETHSCRVNSIKKIIKYKTNNANPKPRIQ